MSEFVYDKPAVGVRVQEKRLALRLTQEMVAERLGKSLRLITEIERGMVGMSIETLLGLCEVLKTTPNDLLMPQKENAESELDWVMGALTNASDHVRASAIDILRTYLRST
ncbi:MAG: helix-turn-helix transcriptional regulator [Clostridia bacterium]|nr:helix-turn-helix transcriptional regulator [Clostridia bacterium]